MAEDMYIRVQEERAKLMRYDTAVILKRFFFCEHSLILSEAGWIPGIAPLDAKLALARIIWQDAMTADAMRQRVFELRYPSRLMEKEGEEPLIQLLDEARNAPSALAFVYALVKVLKPALARAYRAYLQLADTIGDGPSIRFMDLAAREKEQQLTELEALLPTLFDAGPDARAQAEAWAAEVEQHLVRLGGIGLDPVEAEAGVPVELPGRVPFGVAQVPARDPRFIRVRFYWPDMIDPTYPYGEGLRLQVRSAISHLNEVWAVEACAAFLFAFAHDLGWEFVHDAARWVYDESRHCRMGYERLVSWGYQPGELPLGTYIYDAAKDQDPIYRLGMLFFFETKNISKKPKRAEAFAEYEDRLSQHDMDFDWADETIHAHYGKQWLTRLLQVRGDDRKPEDVRARCEELIAAVVADASEEERAQIRAIADRLVAKAERIAGQAGR